MLPPRFFFVTLLLEWPMGFFSLEFVVLLVLSLSLYHLYSAEKWRRSVFAATSIAFVASFASTWSDAGEIHQYAFSLSGLLFFAALAYFFQRYSQAVSGRIYVAMIFVLLLCFVFIKHIVAEAAPLGGMANLSTIGLSYILFRALHLVIDKRAGTLEAPLSVGSCFAYLFCWPTFLSTGTDRRLLLCMRYAPPWNGQEGALLV